MEEDHVRRAVAAFGTALVLVLAGCSTAPDPGPVFDDEGARDLTCMAHQTGAPGARYTDEGMRNTGEVLALMRYYTGNGAKPFCDAAAATTADMAWAQEYVDLGGTAAKVPTIVR